MMKPKAYTVDSYFHRMPLKQDRCYQQNIEWNCNPMIVYVLPAEFQNIYCCKCEVCEVEIQCNVCNLTLCSTVITPWRSEIITLKQWNVHHYHTIQYFAQQRPCPCVLSSGKQQQEMVVHQNLIADENIVVRYQVSLIATYFPQYILSSFYFQFYTKSFSNSMAT